jgi:3',5'-cyclic AMP phosphodiesterase CpdA
VISGDMTDKGNPRGMEMAYKFVSLLINEFGLSGDRCILVPGNHDVQDRDESVQRQLLSGLATTTKSP